jgi:hypothetical protein
MIRKVGGIQRLAIIGAAIGVALASPARAQEPPTLAAEHVFAAKFDDVWSAAQTFLKTRSVPIPIASADKDPEADKSAPKGVITTSPHRYFKISSATFPPRQQDFRETYTVTVTGLPKGPPPPNPPVPGVAPLPADKPVDLTKVKVERKFERFDKKAKGWVDGDPVKEKAGISAADLFQGVQYQLTPPPPPPPTEE